MRSAQGRATVARSLSGMVIKHRQPKQAQNRSASPMLKAFRENESILRRFLRRFTSNTHDIEDITQETILRALRAEKTTEIEQPRAFLFGIARNVAKKELEKKSRSIVDFIEDFGQQEYISDEPSLEDHLDGRQQMLLFAEAVATLPAQCQKVFVLKKVYGYSHQEISKDLGISISTTEKHVVAGLKRCSEFMARRLQDEVSKSAKQSPAPQLRKSRS